MYQVSSEQHRSIISAILRSPVRPPKSMHGSDSDDVTMRFPIGTKLRVIPNHACATGAQFPEYHALAANCELTVWGRFHGW